jgi:1,4-alpha-glucan branching enzyme
VQFSSTRDIDVKYDNTTMEVSFTPKNNFSGMELIPFKLAAETYQIPVKLKKTQKYLFTYKPQAGEKEVNLFGQFNSWDRHNLPLKDLNGDGVLEIEIPLDPGRY